MKTQQTLSEWEKLVLERLLENEYETLVDGTIYKKQFEALLYKVLDCQKIICKN